MICHPTSPYVNVPAIVPANVIRHYSRSFISYPKIDTFFERRENFKVDISKIKPQFANITTYDLYEKVDGMNIQVCKDECSNVIYGGRTENAVLPLPLIEKLKTYFSLEKINALFKNNHVVFYGEGYGDKIQGNPYFLPKGEQDFILFDILVDKRYWLDQKDVKDIAEKLNIPLVPMIGTFYTLGDLFIHLNKSSVIAKGITQKEGVIGRCAYTLFYKNGHPVIFKLKNNDF